MATNELDIKVNDVSFNYDNDYALNQINCHIPSGSLSCIIGPNGSGKSTLLKCITGILKPTSGSISFPTRKSFAYVPQRESVDWDFPISVMDVVLMGRVNRKSIFSRYSNLDKQIAKESIEKVGLPAFANRQIAELSGGQQQRVFLARALARQADILIMDEPFAAVDYATEESLVAIMKTLQSEGITQLIVHHDLNTIQTYFDYTILLNKQLIAEGKTNQVFTPENLESTYHRKIRVL